MKTIGLDNQCQIANILKTLNTWLSYINQIQDEVENISTIEC